MNIRVFKFFRTLHAWGGVTLALLMLVISTTGTLIVWKRDYVWLIMPEARVNFDPTPIALARIAEAAEANFDSNNILQIDFATEDFALTKVTLVDSHYAYLDSAGKVVTRWALNDRWEEWLYDLHHRLLLENLGLTIVGFGSMAMIILVLAGVVSFWPMRRGFREGLIPVSASPRYLRSAHRNIGIVIALPFLMSLVTGVMLVYPDQATQLLLEPFRGEDYSLDFEDQVDAVSGGYSGQWLPAMQRTLSVFPGGSIRSAQGPNSISSYRVIGVQHAGEFNPLGVSKVYIDSESGHMDIRIDSQAQHVSERIYNAGYPLHTGRIGNVFYKILLTLSGLLVATLSTLGLVSFIKARL
jgi:uncharacterized iron-regulated membrane protein